MKERANSRMKDFYRILLSGIILLMLQMNAKYKKEQKNVI